MSRIDELELRRRQRESQRAFYRALAGGSDTARLIRLEGIEATIVPAREWFSIFSSAFYREAADLQRGYSDLAAQYDAAVKAWTVWVPPGDEPAAAILEQRGHVLDSTPMLFAAALDALDLEPRMELDLVQQPSWEAVAKVNDLAHGVLEPWSMAAVFERMDDPASHLHIARRGEAPAAALIAREHEGDCYFWFVATVPEAQGRGLGSELMRHALRAARARGCTTSTLESTQVAERMYGRLGYKPLGRYQMWERRSA